MAPIGKRKERYAMKREEVKCSFEKPGTEAIWEYTEESRLVRTYEAVNMEKHILATYYMEVKPHLPLSVAAEHLAAEQSTGTRIPVRFETPETR
jgi:hypothetical protein